ncbi:uncharacterized protein LOC131668635 isoform X2 [Phymastichus coffea]|uniref:uncharacterized protein LOC131668635 isoform X2 n=1 Tax=Phymastichus coffea TaxID=108790 RepID=UPI00273ADE4C|nr:uncharacterized protein LOC131668635 isoform X2 [Phymastichus coffea]
MYSKRELTMLHVAAQHGNVPMAIYAIDRAKIPIEARNEASATPLMVAIDERRWEFVKFLIQRGADMYLRDDYGYSGLSRALECDDPNIVNAFIEKVRYEHPDKEDFVRTLGEHGCTIEKIVKMRDPEKTQIFLNLFNRQRIIDRIASRESVKIAMKAMDEENLKVLLNSENGDRRITFLYAIHELLVCSYNNASLTRVVQKSIDQMLDWKVLTLDNFFTTESLVQQEPEKGIRVVLTDRLISYVKEELNFDVQVYLFGNKLCNISEFVKSGVIDFNMRGNGGLSALHIAVDNRAIDTMKYLLDNGFDPNVRDDEGRTPIFKGLGYDVIFEILLIYGADIQAHDNDVFVTSASYRASDRNSSPSIRAVAGWKWGQALRQKKRRRAGERSVPAPVKVE